ncbi:MAG: asparagine synthase (glutamine-hydrolyzing), partial [Candidatus Eisenbacteria bacterium]|nr:asparagine synthase (glutamine-hydrolyzing) [Candidatus Eisenbacteria bacterium]
MCGIAGFIERDRSAKAEATTLEKMVEVIHHRGPDSGGGAVVGPAALGMRRLAIIDVAGGDQPMRDDTGRFWLVFNGEIYNFRELAKDLESRGVTLRTRSDTEVLLHLFALEGADCLKKLNGMFAFAAYDKQENRLLLARDRLGIKPLFYRLDKDRLWFGSELKTILADPRVPRTLNRQALHDFLAFNYMPAPLTAMKGISQLLPGTFMLLENGQESIHSYWDLEYEPDHSRDEAYWIEATRSGLEESVKRRLVSDVPFGAFLSGGIDSSAVVAFMSRHLDQPVKTFSIGFEEPSYNELSQAKIAADTFKSEHHELVVKPNVSELISRLVWHSDEPSADSSAIPVFLVSQLARKHVTMALSGDGGDELFAGYETYQAHHWRNQYRKIPKVLRHGVIRPLVHAIPPSSKKVSLEFKAKRFVNGSELSAEQSHYSWRNIFSEAMRDDLYTSAHRSSFEPQPSFRFYEQHFERSRGWDFLNRMLHVDTRFYLPNDMLV